MTVKAGKVWGSTQLIFAKANVEVHRIEVRAGGTCSEHAHVHKHNAFFVEKGRLLISVWQKAYDLIDETILEARDYTEVPPGLFHSFQALEDTVAYEIYWVSLDSTDIIRRTVGSAG